MHRRCYRPGVNTAVRLTSDSDLDRLAQVLETQWGARSQSGLGYGESLLRLREAGGLGVWVADVDGEIVSYGVGFVTTRLPSVWNPTGVVGYVQSMVTREDQRRRGYGSAILAKMLAWMDAQGAGFVQLVASGDGESLYVRHGFVREPYGEPMVRADDNRGDG